MLHIITPLYRFNLIEKVYQSIPKNEDITWHIAKSNQREKLNHDFINTDSRIKLYELDCLDSDTVTKRNMIFDQIKDGYFYCLDDDTILLEALYRVYKEYSQAGFIGMIIGKNDLGLSSYPSEDPFLTRIDTGMVLCHYSVLKTTKWEWSNEYGRDGYFWSRCFSYFGKTKTIKINTQISIYNHFGPKIKVRKKLFFIKINHDIYNLRIAKCYVFLFNIKFFIKKTLNLRKP